MADVTSNTEETLLVILFAMLKELVVTVEAFLAETALGVTLEAGGLLRVLL
jgi:hypothetical protein